MKLLVWSDWFDWVSSDNPKPLLHVLQGISNWINELNHSWGILNPQGKKLSDLPWFISQVCVNICEVRSNIPLKLVLIPSKRYVKSHQHCFTKMGNCWGFLLDIILTFYSSLCIVFVPNDAPASIWCSIFFFLKWVSRLVSNISFPAYSQNTQESVTQTV